MANQPVRQGCLEWGGNNKDRATVVGNRIPVRMRVGWFVNVYVRMNLRDGAQRPALGTEN